MPQRDGAAVDVDLVHVGLVHLGPAQHHRREGLVDLDDVDIAHLHAGLFQDLGGGLDRAVEVVVGLGADEGLADDAGPGPQAQCFGPVLVHPQHRGRAVGDLRRGARGVDAALDDGLEGGQSLQRRLAQALVAADEVPLGGRLLVLVEHRRLDRGDLAVEPVLIPGTLGMLLRHQAEVVDVGSSDAAPLGDALGGGELVGHVDVP